MESNRMKEEKNGFKNRNHDTWNVKKTIVRI